MHGRRVCRDRIGVARVKRRLRQRADGMVRIAVNVGRASLQATGSSSLASPRRRWFAAGRAPDGCCAAKRETFVGWRVHLVCRPDGVTVRVSMQPTPSTHRMRGGLGGASGLPAGARRLGKTASKSAADAARILAKTGAPLVVRLGAAVRPHAWWMDAIAVRAHRRGIEMTNGQPSPGDDGQ